MKQFLSDEEIKLLIKEYQKNNSISARNKIIDQFYFFDCFEILQLYNTLKKEGSYKVELDRHKIKIELDTRLCTLEKKDNKYHLFGETINESFDTIWDLFNYLGKHYKRQYIRINDVKISKTDDKTHLN